ncbi:MAG TPA: PAS domain S-box protein [Candidatus Obscuribacterales bacterium]
MYDRIATTSRQQDDEPNFRLLVESVKDYEIIMLDPNGYIRTWNAGLQSIKGYQVEEIVGRHFSCFFPPEDVEQGKPIAILATAIAQGYFAEEGWRLRKDGSRFWASVTLTPLTNAAGQLQGFSKVTQDITARKLTQSLLNQNLEILNLASDAIIIRDMTDQIFYWNRGAETLYGWTAREVLGQCIHTCLQTILPEPLTVILAELRQKGHWEGELQHIRRDGQPVIVASHWTLQRGENGQTDAILEINTDITESKRVEDERKQAEAALSVSQSELMTLFGAMQDVILVIDAEGRYLKIAPSCAPLLYRPSADLVGKTLHEVLPQAAADSFLQHIHQALTTKVAVKVEYSLPVAGQLIWFDATLTALNEESVLWVARDISEAKRDEVIRKQVEQAVQEQLRLTAFRADVNASLTRSEDIQTMLRRCTEAMALHLNAAFARIWLLNTEENVLELQASAGMYTHIDGGHARVPVGKFKIGTIAETCRPHLTNSVLDDPLVSNKEWARREEMVAFAGYPLMLEGQLLGVIAMFARHSLTDSTLDELGLVAQEMALGIKRKQTEMALRRSEARLREKAQELEETLCELQQTQTQIIQSEKMSSLGQLVAGVAHEINNPVNFIYGNLKHADDYTQDLLGLLKLYQQHYPNPATEVKIEAEAIDLDFLVKDLPKLMASMKVGADRIRQIVVSLRNFSRMDEAEMKEVDLHEGIDSTLMILQNRLKAEHDSPAIRLMKNYSDLPLVECYAGQLNQVFMNILSNAIDAIKEKNQQRSFKEIEQHPGQIHIWTEKLGSDRVRIRIADNGLGISPTIQQHLFDPFFTTKPVGKGTGLGMSISYQIVTEKHGGSLYCVSEIGQGAEFVIEIPIRQEKR